MSQITLDFPQSSKPKNGHGHGRKPSCRLKPLSAEQRAFIAWWLLLFSSGFRTIKEAAAAVGLSSTYVSVYCNATVEQRLLMREGELTLSALVNKCKPRPTPSDADVEKAVEKLGVERVWHAVERITQPQLPITAGFR